MLVAVRYDAAWFNVQPSQDHTHVHTPGFRCLTTWTNHAVAPRARSSRKDLLLLPTMTMRMIGLMGFLVLMPRAGVAERCTTKVGSNRRST